MGVQRRRAGAILENEVFRVVAALNPRKRITHCLLGGGGDDLRTGDIFAIFGVVRDRVVHVGDAAFVNQIHDQLHFVQALEVRHLGRVTCLDQRLIAGLDQFDQTAAKYRLFAEEIGLGLFAEVRFDDTGARAADDRGVGETGLARVACRVLMDGEQAGHARAAHVLVPHEMARPLRRNHEDAHILRRRDVLVVNREAVREGQILARRH